MTARDPARIILAAGGTGGHMFPAQALARELLARGLHVALVTDRLRHSGIGPIPVAAVGMIGFIVVQGVIVSGAPVPPELLWMGFGFFGSAGIIVYAGLNQRFPPELAGRVVTGVNVMTFFAAFALQWAIGAVIDLYPPTAPGGEGGGYAPEGYRAAFMALIAMQTAACIWFLGFRRAAVN